MPICSHIPRSMYLWLSFFLIMTILTKMQKKKVKLWMAILVLTIVYAS